MVHLDADEAALLRSQAAELVIDNPVVDDKIRMSNGECAFLAKDRKCRIHAHFGGDAKPLVCRQFPFVLIEAETGLRAGVDPASVAWHTSREGGDAVQPPAGVRPRATSLSPEQLAVEQHLVALCGQPDTTLQTLVDVLTGGSAGFEGRFLERVREAPLALLLGHATVGPDHRRILMPLVTDLPERPPALNLDADLEREAVALIRDALYLRVITKIPLVQATALLLVGGALLAAWSDPSKDAFRPVLSLWCRTLRAGPFWQALVPDPGVLQWLATGELEG